MEIKYRLHEVAKDLNVPNKEIIALIEKHFGETKKHMTALTEEELNVVFEHYVSQKGTVQNLDAYFAMQNRPKKEEPKPQPKRQQNQPRWKMRKNRSRKQRSHRPKRQ